MEQRYNRLLEIFYSLPEDKRNQLMAKAEELQREDEA